MVPQIWRVLLYEIGWGREGLWVCSVFLIIIKCGDEPVKSRLYNWRPVQRSGLSADWVLRVASSVPLLTQMLVVEVRRVFIFYCFCTSRENFTLWSEHFRWQFIYFIIYNCPRTSFRVPLLLFFVLITTHINLNTD